MSPPLRVVSADSHVLEPPDLWTRRLPDPHRKRAPRIVESDDTGALLIGPGLSPVSMLDASAPGTRLAGHRVGLRTLRRGGFDVAARLEDCDVDGIDAEILYPTTGMFLFGGLDPDLRRACITAYNDWLGELCAEAPDRLFPLALLDVGEPEWAAEELTRRRGQGFVGGILPGSPPEGHYGEDRFDLLWAATGDAPLSIHAFTEREDPDRIALTAGYVDVMAQIHRLQRTLGSLAVTALPRFPSLRIVASEYDAGWVPHFLERLDRLVDRNSKGDDAPPEPPSAYIRRQVTFGFQVDRAAIALRHDIGVEALLWGSDYPHVSSFWPHSQKVLDELLVDVPDDERAAIVGGNAMALYGLPARASAAPPSP
jgi:predicted TIM-barrel fold metal-dependent hydrolase